MKMVEKEESRKAAESAALNRLMPTATPMNAPRFATHLPDRPAPAVLKPLNPRQVTQEWPAQVNHLHQARSLPGPCCRTATSTRSKGASPCK